MVILVAVGGGSVAVNESKNQGLMTQFEQENCQNFWDFLQLSIFGQFGQFWKIFCPGPSANGFHFFWAIFYLPKKSLSLLGKSYFEVFTFFVFFKYDGKPATRVFLCKCLSTTKWTKNVKFGEVFFWKVVRIQVTFGSVSSKEHFFFFFSVFKQRIMGCSAAPSNIRCLFLKGTLFLKTSKKHVFWKFSITLVDGPGQFFFFQKWDVHLVREKKHPRFFLLIYCNWVTTNCH